MYLIDSIRIAKEYTTEQLGANIKYCNLGARNTFHAGLLAVTMKYITGFNQHSNWN